MATSTSGLRKKDEKITISNQELLKALEGCGKWHFQMGSLNQLQSVNSKKSPF